MQNENIVRIAGVTRADALEIGEYAGPENVSFEDQQIMEGSSGELVLGAALVMISAVALKGFIAYLKARYPAQSSRHVVLERIKDGETVRLTLDTTELKDGLSDKVATELASFSGIPVSQLLVA